MKYTFVSLGKFESLGVRLGGAGLGNILFPWARSIVYAKRNNLLRIQTTWNSIKIGTFFRKERDKRLYYDLFTGRDGIRGLKKFLLLNFSNDVKYFSGMQDLFSPFIKEHDFIKSELLKIVNPYYINKVNSIRQDFIAIHIRMGDFIYTDNEDKLRSGVWNHRIPLRWYKSIINKIRKETDISIYVFSDACDNELKEILDLENCKRVYFGSAIGDMLALSNARLLVASASTFSMWASFLGKTPTIWFPGQMRQRVVNEIKVFEGELDYNEELPELVLKLIK